MAKTIKVEDLNLQGIKDTIANLKEALYWANRVGIDPAQVNIPSDEYDQPAQASQAITQGIILLTGLLYEAGDVKVSEIK